MSSVPQPEPAELLRLARGHATASWWRASWQLVNTLMPLAALVVLVHGVGVWLGLLLSTLIAAFVVRTFVLQHDAGHLSLFPSKRVNNVVGALLGCITGVPFHAWRTEHNWHHAHQGKLHERGVDAVNSPMTVAEVRANPGGAAVRGRRISLRNILVLGAISIGVTRKTSGDYFMFRSQFRHPVRRPERFRRSVYGTVAAHFGLHAVLSWWMGPLV